MPVRAASTPADGDVERLRAEAEELRRRLRAAAHEIRTPLTGAATIVDILSASEMASGRTGEYVHLLKDAVTQLVAVANDILDLGRLEADLGLGLREPFSPKALVESVSGLARVHASAKQLTVTLQSGPLPERLLGYPVMIRRALENLIDNAVKHTVLGGVIVNVGMTSGRVLQIAVTDSGEGIAREDLPQLFEPYAQLASGARIGGTGLGLALVKAAVDRVGGTIAVESKSGVGTTFCFTVPVEAALPHQPAPQQGEYSAQRSLSILVAEDNPVNRIVTGAILGEFGHHVAFSHDGQAAVEALQASDFDLVLMDIEMPGLDGLSALRAIRALSGPRAETPVVALSARGDEARREVMEQGFDAYVVKPIDPGALFRAIEQTSGGAAA